jgi:hypothetical protein
MSSKQDWSCHLVVQQHSCFLSATWHGEAFHRLGVQGVEVLIFLGALFLPSLAHAACFCTLVAILDLPKGEFPSLSGEVVASFSFSLLVNINCTHIKIFFTNKTNAEQLVKVH